MLLEMFRELAHARIKFLRRLGDFLRVLRLRVLLPAHAHRTQQRDERRRRRQQNPFLRRPDDQIVVAFQRRAEQRFRRHEQHDVIQRVRKLARIIAVGQRLDGGLQFRRVRRQRFRAFAPVRPIPAR